MYIKTLALQNFRNYEDRSVDFDAGVNILTGKNGEGKTNMLEAVHILSMGRSFRTQNDAEAIQFGKEFYRIKGLFEKTREDLTVEVRMQGQGKFYFIDGIKVQKGADLLDHALTVIFSPDDLRIVKDGPEKRRRFMDHELFQLKPLYYLDVIKYRRIVRNRNLLLKEPVLNEHLLDIYDGYFAETGARIMAERAGFAARLAKISAGIQGRITAGSAKEAAGKSANESAAEASRLEVSYEPSIEIPGSACTDSLGAVCADSTDAGRADSTDAARIDSLGVGRTNAPDAEEEIPGSPDAEAMNPSHARATNLPAGKPAFDRTRQLQEAIADELKARRAKDREAGSTMKGPHKDDLKLASGGIDLRKYGSQGQQRTAALALKLAEVDIIKEETGEMPILLLDDVLSELDEDRQRDLLGSFEDCQIIITTAELSESLSQTFPAARRIEIKSNNTPIYITE